MPSSTRPARTDTTAGSGCRKTPAGRQVAGAIPRSPVGGYSAAAGPERGDKVTRFGPFSAQCRAGNVDILRGAWNEEFFSALEGFPDAAHDDDADACGGASRMFVDNSLGMLDWMAAQAQAARAQKGAGMTAGGTKTPIESRHYYCAHRSRNPLRNHGQNARVVWPGEPMAAVVPETEKPSVEGRQWDFPTFVNTTPTIPAGESNQLLRNFED